MVLRNINVTEALCSARQAAAKADVSSEVRAMLQVLIAIIEIFMSAHGANSKNSSKPPSQDPNRKKSSRAKGERKPGGQKGHTGNTLNQVDEPDEIVHLPIDRSHLPAGKSFRTEGTIKRQVFDAQLKVVVTEYQAEVLVDEDGNRYIADFPPGVEAPVQYGPTTRGLVAYSSAYQFIPAERICDQLAHVFGLPMSPGTVMNIIAEAARRLGDFRRAAIAALRAGELIHLDETGINLSGKRAWIHSGSNELWTLFAASPKRGLLGTEELGVAQGYGGILMHDNWAPYFKLECLHALCNAHHLRELTRAHEDESQSWAGDMIRLLTAINKEVLESSLGCLSHQRAMELEAEFDKVVAAGEKECPKPKSKERSQRGRQKNPRCRNLLERLRERKASVLLFMWDPRVPFTNNQAERDLRMTKVHQKVSGCFRSLEGAQNFCLIRSFVSTCVKHGLSASAALSDLFRGVLPDFVQSVLEAEVGPPPSPPRTVAESP